jgi:hypothetical protein
MKIGPVDPKKILIGGPKVVVVRILYKSKEPAMIFENTKVHGSPFASCFLGYNNILA